MTARLRPVCGTPVFAALDDARPRTLLVSDLHVPPTGGPVLDALLELLALASQEPARTRLLVLGDLLESLVNERQLGLGNWPRLIAGFRAAVEAGVSVSVLHGNRDFMLGARFAAATLSRVVRGGLALHLSGVPTLALHGDELCSNDVGYQKIKPWLRGHVVRGLCRMMPLALAGKVGKKARAKSGASMMQGDALRFRPVVQALDQVFAAGYQRLIFGHVHTPARGRHGDGEYLILPAFDATQIYLHDDGAELRFAALPGQRPPPSYGPAALAPALHPAR